MSKKRRVTQEQAYLLAVALLRDVLTIEMATGPGTSNHPRDLTLAYLVEYLPEKWFDDQTSEQSWEHVWQETKIQLENILESLGDEASRIAQNNPTFTFTKGRIARKTVSGA